MKKPPLRTSKDVYDRLKWDSSFPAEDVWIGYEDRMEGSKELPFAEFRPGGRIPWARLQYFRMGNRRIWDREKRIDLVFGSGDTTESETLDASLHAAGFGNGFISRRAWHWEQLEGQWESARMGESPRPHRLRIATWNLLRSDIDLPGIHHPSRIRHVVDHLHTFDADIIALQEVTSDIYQLLLDHPFIRGKWYLSDGPRPETLGDLGILFLSRIRPAQILEFRFPGLRPAMVMRVEFPGQALNLVSVHLPSNRRPDAHLVRQQCLDQITAALPKGEANILLGDLNFGDDGDEELPEAYTDLWKRFHPGDPGYTFDPDRNHLAEVNSLYGKPLRLDRIFVHDPEDRLVPDGIEMAALETMTNGQSLSDHYALVSSLLMDTTFLSLQSAPTTHRSALCIIPPPQAQAEIQALRRLYDDRFHRWMPHINLLYGFLPDTMFEAAGSVIGNSLQDFPPFEVELSGFSHFEHSRSATVWLRADEAGQEKMVALQAILQDAFPQCTEQDRNGVFTPHLSTGKLRGEAMSDRQPLIREWNAAWSPIRFAVDRVFLISRRENEPFQVRQVIGLTGNRVEPVVPGLEQALGMGGWLPAQVTRSRQKRLIAELMEAHQSISGAQALHLIGSVGLETDLNGGDLDFLATGTLRRGAYFGHLERMLQGKALHQRRVEDALVPILKIDWAGTKIDILYAQSGTETDARDLLSRSGLEEMAWLKAKAGEHLPAFQTVVRALKAFARSQDMDDHAFGWPGGMAWTLIAASVPPRQDPGEWLVAALERLCNHNWEQALCLGESPEEAHEAPMAIHSAAHPAVNVTRNVTEGNRQTLLDHVLQAWEIALMAQKGEGEWTDLFSPKDQPYPAAVQIRLRAGNKEEMEVVIGWWRRHALSLILHWEAQLPLSLRAFPSVIRQDAHTALQHFGVEGLPDFAQQRIVHDMLSELEDKFRGWEGRPATAGFSTQLLLEEFSPGEFRGH